MKIWKITTAKFKCTREHILGHDWLTKGRDTRCDKSLRHVAMTGCCNKSPRGTCQNQCRCDRILSLRSVARIQTGLNSCDISQRQNKRKALSQQQCRRDDLSPRFVALCVSTLKSPEIKRARGVSSEFVKFKASSTQIFSCLYY